MISAAGVPVTRLSVIYRQEGQSLIVVTAHAINSGDASLPPSISEISALPSGIDLAFVLATSAEDCLRKVVDLCIGHIPRNYPRLDPINDVQVLAPMHKGVAGVTNLNLELQAALNGEGRAGPLGPPVGRGGPGSSAPPRTGSPPRFRPGDKIIQLRNNYDKNLFNGDIGFVVAADGAGGTLTAEFDGERHEFTRGEISDLSLAYAISIHKSQGSEYPVVIIPLLKAHFMMLERNLLYTAITRGRKKVFLVGEPAAYAMAVRNRETKRRITHLRQKIAQFQLASFGKPSDLGSNRG
jgi:exodeoxyribonuclease V alpha subunit